MLARDGWPTYVFAFHDGEEIGPILLSRIVVNCVTSIRSCLNFNEGGTLQLSSFVRRIEILRRCRRIVSVWPNAAVLVLAAISASPNAASSQSALPVVRASTGWAYAVASHPTNPRGAVVLMPGFGGPFGDFSDFSSAHSARPALADSLASDGIALIMIAPPAGVLFGGRSHIRQLEETIVEALRAFSDRALPLAIGGFSAGGTDAVLLAERCGAGACTMPHTVKAVFEVDAPLDWYRLWDNAVLVLANAPPRANVAEARLSRAAIEARIGRQPTRTSRAYLAASPLASRARDGGNARALAGIAVRAYTEPDIDWWITNRSADYYGMNSLDAAALVRHLLLLGNAQAQLITTSGKGFRADGTRHPHSWSIVDQSDLARWIALQIAK